MTDKADESKDFDIVPDAQLDDSFSRSMNYEIPEKRGSLPVAVTVLVVGLVLALASIGSLAFLHVFA